MEHRHSGSWAFAGGVALLMVLLLIGCAAIPSERSLINTARAWANQQGVDAEKYSATVADRGADYFVLFTRKTWFLAVGDHFGVFINKETGNCTLVYGL